MRLQRNWTTAATLALALGLPTLASAHPGHGLESGFAAGFLHPWTGADHVLAMVAVGLFAAGLGGRALWAVPASFVGLMAVGGAMGMAGVGLPFAETMIAGSVIALGFAVAARRRWPTAAAMAFVGLFAVFHGYAHGTEAPGSAASEQFGLGFVAATAGLHLVGVTLGLAAGRLRPEVSLTLARVSGAAIALAGVGLLAGT